MFCALLITLAALVAQPSARAAGPTATGDANSCAQVKQQLAGYQGPAKIVSCADVTPRTSTKAAQGVQPLTATSDATTPGLCNLEVQASERFDVCHSFDVNGQVLYIHGAVDIVGTYSLTVLEDYELIWNSPIFYNDIRIYVHDATGESLSQHPEILASCSATCDVGVDLPPTTLVPNTIISGTVTVWDSAMPANSQVNYPVVDYTLSMPAPDSYTVNPHKWSSPRIRCDGDPSQNNSGCVNPLYTPFMTSMNSLPHIAANIKRIQDSGPAHYGRWNLDGTGNPLHRQKGGGNRDFACPPPHPNPYPGSYSCDEYPFNTAVEGAGNPGIDPANYGSEWVPNKEQGSQAGLITYFYNQNRVLDKEAFWVAINSTTQLPPPPTATVSIVGGLSSGATFSAAGATTLTASASASDDLRFHFQQSGVDKLVSPSVPVTAGTTNYSWSFDPATLPNGQYEAFAQSSLAGVVSRSEVVTITVAIPPKVTIDSGLVNGGTYGDSPISVTGSATPAADYFFFHFQQGGVDKLVSPPVWGTPGTTHHTWQFEPASLPNGSYQLFAAATLGGLSGKSATITININNAPAGQGGSWLTAAAGGGFQLAWPGRDANYSLWLGSGSGTSLAAKDDPFLLGVAYGTKPSIATLSDGSWVAAWQGRDANNSLWLATGHGSTITAKDDPFLLGVAPGTSPSIVALPGNRWEVAWQGRDSNNSLWLATGTGTTITAKADPWLLGVAPNTSPSLAALPNGGFEVAWQGRDSNNSLWLATGAGTTITAKDDPWLLGVAYGTSPSLAALPNGNFQVAWQGRDSNNSLWLATGSGATITAKDDPWLLGVAYGTSPSIATLSDGSWVAAWQGRDSNNSLWLATGTGTTMTAKGDPWLLGVDGGSSPTITGLPGNKWVAAWQGRDSNNSLWFATGSGVTITAKDDPWLLGVAGVRTIVTDGTSYRPGFTWTGLRTKLVFQNDGNLVVYRLRDGAALWASNTPGHPNATLVAQTDGNLVIYDGPPIWGSGTDKHPGDRLVVQDDGNVVIYANGGGALWATGTVTS